MNNEKTRSSLLGVVGAYLLYTAWDLWQERGNTDTVMTAPARIAFIALFVLAGGALLIYAVRVWKRGGSQKEENPRQRDDENSLK